MSINKAFVVKNSFEVSTDLILANADTRKVGIATINPQYELDVAGGIGATDFYLTGIGTFVNELNVGLGGTVLTVLGLGNSMGVGTANPRYLLDIRSPVSTGQTALYVQGDVRITGDLSLDDITLDDATIQDLYVTNTSTVDGISLFNSNVLIDAALNVVGLTTLDGYVDINNSVDISGALNVVGLTTLDGYVDINNSVDISNDLNVSGIATIGTVSIVGAALSSLVVSGISTLGTVKISSGIITAASGIVTYYGDGQYLDLGNNPSTGIGIGTTGGIVGYGITFLDLKGAGVSTTFYDSSVGIATIFFEGGGSGTIGIGTEFPIAIQSENGDLFYNINYGRLFVYYDEDILGIGTDAFWIDAAPFNVGILNLVDLLTLAQGSASSPTLNFYNDVNTGLFSSGTGQQTFVSAGSSILNINPSGIDVSGIVTASSFVGNLTGTASTAATSATAYGLTGSPNITVGTITGAAATFTNLTVNGTQTIINTTSLEITDKNIGIGSTSSPTDALADGSGLMIYGSTNKTLTWERDTGCFEYNQPNKFRGVIETVAVGSTFDLGGGRVVLELDVRNATTYTHNLTNGSVGIVSFKNMPADTGVSNGTTITVLFTQNSAGTGNTTAATGIGTNITVIGFEDGATVSGISTITLVGSGTTLTLSTTASDRDFVSFFVHYTGGTNTTASSYQVYATMNGGFR